MMDIENDLTINDYLNQNKWCRTGERTYVKTFKINHYNLNVHLSFRTEMIRGDRYTITRLRASNDHFMYTYETAFVDSFHSSNAVELIDRDLTAFISKRRQYLGKQ